LILSCARHGRAFVAALLVIALALNLYNPFAVSVSDKNYAWADEADDVAAAQAILDDAEEQMSLIVEQCDTLSDTVDDLQEQINEMAAEALDAQQAVLDGRENLSELASSEYREGTNESIINLIFGSQNFSELVQNIEYIIRLMNYQADQIEDQKDRQQYFDSITADLNDQKNTQEAVLASLEEKKAEAADVVENAKASLSDAQEAYAERLAELEAQAKAVAEKQAAEQQAAGPSDSDSSSQDSSSTDTTTTTETVTESTSSSTSSDTTQQETTVTEDTSTETDTSTDSSAGWLSGSASAYGGSSDPNTPNPGTTATGAVCDDNSMGVAISTSMPNYKSYLGRTVEISYGGRTVYATVNDCGSLGGGSRVLDLQPGVFKALGFSTCQAWGVRTVSYRFL
ncbi:MAG: hypothetical protein LUB61_04210, partial [Eggerthellaceae bacterium]|nr:hypothetical protein [Eggerthellaceae bacterium]